MANESEPRVGAGWSASVSARLAPAASAGGPVQVAQLLALARSHHQAGRLAQAEPLYRQVLALHPNHADGLHLMGLLAHQVGRNDVAVKLIGQAIRVDDRSLAFHSDFAAPLKALGRLEEAAASLRRAIALAPTYAMAHCNLGVILKDLGRRDEEAAAYRRAIELDPRYAEAHYNFGGALQELDRHDEAAAAYRRAIDLKPDFAGAYNNLGVSLQVLGRFEESASIFRRAIELKPDYVWAYNNLGVALLNLNRLDEADAAYRSAINLQPNFAEADSGRLMGLNYRPDISGEALLAEHRGWDERHAAGLLASAAARDRDPERRLRIGYVSGDLCRHSVAYSLVDVLASHDRSGFEVFCYSTSATVDDMTERLRGLADHWRSLAGVPDDDAAALIRQDQIDVLVDLAGHTAHNRLLLFARKPTPVQVNWMGYPNTTGLAAMDYRLVDPITDPPGIAEAWASEALVRLEGGFLCYAPPPDAPQVTPPPSLTSGTVTFGSFNNPPKLSDPTIETWAAVLAKTPGSKLLLKGRPFGEEAARARMQARFAAHGIGPERLILLAWIAGTGSHLEAYSQIDIGLDPFPYNGTTTTCEALWMGVPVVSLLGERHVARVGASLLSRVGLQDLIAEDKDRYVEIAAALAQDTTRLANLRQGLRDRVKACSLGDGRQFTPTLETAFRQMWRRWCAGEPAKGFDVPAND